MFRPLISILALLFTAAIARAHFVFIVPDSDGKHAKVILSENLQPDSEVDIAVISAAKLAATDADNHDTALTLEKSDHAYQIDLPAAQARLIHGVAEIGIQQHGDSKPFLLIYYPKTILGDPFDPQTHLGDRAPLELVATGKPGQLKFQLLAAAKPVPDAEIDLILPDGTQKKVTTDKNGESESFDQPGRYGAWARHFESTPGERDGKKFDEVHQYATLVFDIHAAPTTAPYAPLPQAASSFGAVACDGWLYVYGGHTADTHSYSTASVSGKFSRLNLSNKKTWEELPGGQPLQGMNLATWHGKIYLVGGMSPRNKPDQPSDVRSVADCACFDPATMKWTALPPLPVPRSSHDVAVARDQLIVVGGWNLTGDPDNAHWLDTTLTLDLSSPNPQWKSVKQPFQRRALIAASYHQKVYVIGGFDTDSSPSRKVDIYDPQNNQWAQGPDLPVPDENGFGPAACVLDDNLYVSVADGTLYRLNDSTHAWEKIAATTPRIVHRMAPNGPEILVIGGAAKQKQLNLIEAVTPIAPSSK